MITDITAQRQSDKGLGDGDRGREGTAVCRVMFNPHFEGHTGSAPQGHPGDQREDGGGGLGRAGKGAVMWAEPVAQDLQKHPWAFRLCPGPAVGSVWRGLSRGVGLSSVAAQNPGGEGSWAGAHWGDKEAWAYGSG